MHKRGPLQVIRAVLFALIIREVRGRFGMNRLGAFWFLFEPISHVAILLMIFSLARAHAQYGPPTAMFLVSGIVPFLLFKNIALKGMEAVSANKALFAYRQIKPFDTILARAIVECALMACVYMAMIFVLGFWGGLDVAIHDPLQWFGVILIGGCLSFGMALVFCVVGEAMPELKGFIRMLFMPLYFISCVILPLWAVPPQFRAWIWWNPFLHIIDGLREATFLHYPTVAGVSLKYAAVIALVFLFIGVIVYRQRREQLLAI